MKTILLMANIWLFGLVALLHLYWVLDGKWALANTLPQRSGDQRPVLVPNRLITLAVACLLLLGMLLNISLLPGHDALLNEKVRRYGLLAIGLLLGLRTIGDFRYVSLTKRIRDTSFAGYDTTVYTPLCAAFACSHLLCFSLLT